MGQPPGVMLLTASPIKYSLFSRIFMLQKTTRTMLSNLGATSTVAIKQLKCDYSKLKDNVHIKDTPDFKDLIQKKNISNI